jgi:hypothetical protein
MTGSHNETHSAEGNFPIEINRPYYFIHPRAPIVTLVFVRLPSGGAQVCGGPTGSHGTGHGESWWEKLHELVGLGYIPIDVARERGIISAEWKPPVLNP